MGSYKNGQETKNEIYSSARNVFYQKGFSNATIKEIVERASSKLGLFTYYFESKEEVALSIYKDFVNDILMALETAMPELYDGKDVLVTDMAEYMTYFQCIQANEQTRRFFVELCSCDQFGELTRELKCFFYERLAQSGISINPMLREKTYFSAVASLTAGMENQFFKDVLLKRVPLNFAAATDFFLNEYYRFLVNDRALIRGSLHRANQILRRLSIQVEDGFALEITLDQ